MLRRTELQPNVLLFRFYSFINFIPLEFDPVTWKAVLRTSTLRLALWKLNCLLLATLVAFIDIRLFQILLNPQLFNPYHFPIHFVVASFFTFTVYGAHRLFYVDHESTVEIYNEVNGHLLEEFQENSASKSTLRHDLQELLLISSPWLLIPSGIFVLAMCTLDPNRMQFEYALLPAQYQTLLMLILNIFVECTLYHLGYATCSFGVYTHLAFFRDCLSQLRKMRTNITDGTVRALRKLQVVIQTFNETQSGFIFGLQLFIISSAILSNFVGIRYIQRNLLLGFYGFFLAAHVESTFISQFDHAFSIPLLADHVGKLVLLKAFEDQRCCRYERAIVKRQLRSIPVLGVKVGRFGYLERESTPLFLDYVVNRTTTLLVMFN